MAIAYIVTSGEYSDYHIDAVFSTRKKAEEYIETRKEFSEQAATEPPSFDIEPWEIDATESLSPIKHGYRAYSVWMRRQGNSNVEEIRDYWEAEEIERNSMQQDAGWLMMRVWAKDEQHAVKIVNEKRTMLIANGKWDETLK